MGEDTDLASQEPSMLMKAFPLGSARDPRRGEEAQGQGPRAEIGKRCRRPTVHGEPFSQATPKASPEALSSQPQPEAEGWLPSLGGPGYLTL